MHQQDTKVCIDGKELEDFLKLKREKNPFLCLFSHSEPYC